MPALVLGKKDAPGKTERRVKIPEKRSINLATVNEKKIDLRIAIPAIALILVAAVAFSKFAVLDRLKAVDEAQAEVHALQTRLDAGYAELAGMDDLSEKYAHYTLSGMTQEEQSLVERGEILEMLERVVLKHFQADRWTLDRNTLTLTVTGSTLRQVNELIQDLQEEEIVDYCTVTTASNTSRDKENLSEPVTANIVVYLKPGEVLVSSPGAGEEGQEEVSES